jgi:hypothetical protein
MLLNEIALVGMNDTQAGRIVNVLGNSIDIDSN